MSLIEVVNVKKSFENRELFECKNLTFEKRGLYIVKGPNGCGKTTFLKNAVWKRQRIFRADTQSV